MHAGYDGSPAYVLQTNLTGTINCLEAARRQRRRRHLPLDEPRLSDRGPAGAAARAPRRSARPAATTRPGPGWSAHGITTEFPLSGFRSMYGATKLASELLIEEYRAMYGLRTIVNRCGVHLGPVADGQGRSGVPRAVGGAAPVRRQPVLHRASAAKGCRSATSCTSPTSTTWCGGRSRTSSGIPARSTTSAAAGRTASRSPS